MGLRDGFLPQWVTTVTYIDKIEERNMIGAQIATIIKDNDDAPSSLELPNHGSACFWGFIMTIPFDNLCNLLNRFQNNADVTIFEANMLSWELPILLSIYLSRKVEGYPVSMTDWKQKTFKQMQEAETNARDKGRCVITGALNSKICYIVSPPSRLWNDELEARTRDWCLEGLGFIPHMDLLDSFHRSKNMICLDPQLDTWWRQGHIGLRPLEKLEIRYPDTNDAKVIYGVKIRFHWLKKTVLGDATEDQMVALDTDPRTMFLPRERQLRSTFAKGSKYDSIVEGDEFVISAADEASLPCMKLLAFQWFLTRLEALIGGWDSVMYKASFDPA